MHRKKGIGFIGWPRRTEWGGDSGSLDGSQVLRLYPKMSYEYVSETKDGVGPDAWCVWAFEFVSARYVKVGQSAETVSGLRLVPIANCDKYVGEK